VPEDIVKAANRRSALPSYTGAFLKPVLTRTRRSRDDGGGPLLEASRRFFPFIERAFADAGYDRERATMANTVIVRRQLPSPRGSV